MDFTIKQYSALLESFMEREYTFQTFGEYTSAPAEKVIVLRHDVDRKPFRALRLAEIESNNDIKASYMFRIVTESKNRQVIEQIVSMGHEIGYHYEDLVMATRKQSVGKPPKDQNTGNDIYLAAWSLFKSNLEYFRSLYPVSVISMHGSPLSKIDNRELWKFYDYRQLDLICEPYFDIDYSKILYLTDTGRSWNSFRYNVRDKISNFNGPTQWKSKPLQGSFMDATEDTFKFQQIYKFKSSKDIIRASKSGNLPDKIILNTHPQRWNDKMIPWILEYLFQNMKNIIKIFLIKMRRHSIINTAS